MTTEPISASDPPLERWATEDEKHVRNHDVVRMGAGMVVGLFGLVLIGYTVCITLSARTDLLKLLASEERLAPHTPWVIVAAGVFAAACLATGILRVRASADFLLPGRVLTQMRARSDDQSSADQRSLSLFAQVLDLLKPYLNLK